MYQHNTGRNIASEFGATKGQHTFAQIPRAEIPRSVLDRSCNLKTAFDAGYLVPIFVDEALPGDTFNMKVELFGRMGQQTRPLMDNVYVDLFWFAAPLRILWTNFVKMMGEQDNPADTTDYEVPTVTPATVTEESLWDYLGIPLNSNPVTVSALFSRMYSLTWNQWFRDENLQDSVVVDLDDGPDDPADYELLRRGRRHDYFTSALPFVQKGAAVELPLGSTAPVVSTGDDIPIFEVAGTSNVHLEAAGSSNAQWDRAMGTGDAKWEDPKLEADLENATASTINDLRQAFQVQRLLERDARGGTRYIEVLQSHFGVTSPDFRLQRVEYLGGGSTRVNSHPIASTMDVGAGLGVLGGFGTFSGSGLGFTKSFVEHSIVMCLANVRTDLGYQQGLNRMFSRNDRWDFYWPALAHLGEQPILNKEIFFAGAAGDDDVFGYQERWAEYRYKPSMVTGKMRSDAVASLDVWHTALDFVACPTLNDVFIEDDPPLDRNLAVPAEPAFILDTRFNFKCARPMPTYSVPGLIDHF